MSISNNRIYLSLSMGRHLFTVQYRTLWPPLWMCTFVHAQRPFIGIGIGIGIGAIIKYIFPYQRGENDLRSISIQNILASLLLWMCTFVHAQRPYITAVCSRSSLADLNYSFLQVLHKKSLENKGNFFFIKTMHTFTVNALWVLPFSKAHF